jgi:hypothetical protein
MDEHVLKLFILLLGLLVSFSLVFPLVSFKMDESVISSRKLVVSNLTPGTYNSWISEIKGIAVRSQVWEFIDPEGSEEGPPVPRYPKYSDYTKVVPVATPASSLAESTQGTILPDPPLVVPEQCSRYSDLSESQKEAYNADERAHRGLQAEARAISLGMEKVHSVILESAKDYVARNVRASSVREILLSLSHKFKKSPDEIQRQIDRRYDELRHSSPTKGKIEPWICQWESLREEITALNVESVYSEYIYTQHFLKAGRVWASFFCDTWIRIRNASGRDIKFFEAANEYRTELEENSLEKVGRRGQNLLANAASLQGQSSSSDQGNTTGNPTTNVNYSNKECLCGETHAWKKCPYLRNEARTSGWKPNKEKRDGIRQKIEGNSKLWWCVKRVASSDILHGIPDPKKSKGTNDATAELPGGGVNVPVIFGNSAGLMDPYIFGNMTVSKSFGIPHKFEESPERNSFGNSDSLDKWFRISDSSDSKEGNLTPYIFGSTDDLTTTKTTITANSISNDSNLLRLSATYDSGCSNHLTWDKSRFIGEITPAFEWVSTPDGDLLVEGFGTMLVNGKLNGRNQPLHFRNTAYVPNSSVTLISVGTLKRDEFYWNMHTDRVEKKGVPIFELEEHFNLFTAEYHPVGHTAAYSANFVGSRVSDIPKGTAWKFHLRLGHCQPEVISQLESQKIINVIKDGSDAPTTVKCETCAMAKMHQLISKISASGKATKPFQRIHFDLIILKKTAFDGTTCIAHFQDDFTSFHWVFPLQGHKQDTLLRVVKHVINRCDRLGAEFGLFVNVFRMDQETSFGDTIQDFVEEQGISFEWSAKHTKEQNGSAERAGSLLTQKARCICIGANLPKDLYPECYLAAGHLLNRIPIKGLDWKSPHIALHRALKKPYNPEVSHLRVFGCKAYPLLKGKDAPPKSEKLSPRAFVGYLIGYDSTNIFRVWNPETWTVSGYRDVIFDEDQTFSTYVKKDLIPEEKMAEFVELEVFDSIPYIFDLQEEDEQWLAISVRNRSLVETPSAVLHVPKESPILPMQSSGQRHLPTPEATPPPPSTVVSSSSATRIVPSSGRRAINLPGNLPDTGRTPLGIGESSSSSSSGPSKDIGSSKLDTGNIVEGKRTRKPKKFANLTTPLEHVSDDKELGISESGNTRSGIRDVFMAFAVTTRSTRLHRDNLPPPPKQWRGMLRHPHADGFRKAAEFEYQTLLKMNTFVIVPKTSSSDQNPIPLMWVFTYKYDPDGFLVKYKARLCVRGDLEEISTEDVYASTLAIKVFRCLMALTSAFGLNTRQFDAINAFLNAKTDRIIHVYMPDGFAIEGKCLLLVRALYGLRKSPLLWLREFSKALVSLDMDLQQLPGEPCLFTDYNGIILFFYVDDIVLIFSANRASDVKRLIQKLNKRFELRDMGELDFFLGVRVIRESDGSISLCQDSYMDKLAIEYQIDVSKSPSAPLPPEFVSISNSVPETPLSVDPSLRHEYRKKVGSICYPASITRPDVAKAASKLAEHLTCPAQIHLDAANHCLQYLHATKHLAIKYSPSGGGELTVQSPSNDSDPINDSTSKDVFENTADASFASSPERRSYEGFTFKLYGGLIDWAARKQATVSTSTTEAELLALLHAGKACIWWVNLFNKLKFDYDHTVKIFNDNKQTIRLLTSEQPKISTKLLHVDVAQLWLRQSVQLGHLNVSYLPTNQMTADGLTKSLPPQKHRAFVKMLGLVDVSRLI